MKNYYWKGIDISGKELSGFLPANNFQELASILLQKNIAVCEFYEKKDKFIFFSKKINNEDKKNLFEQLYALISSGINLLDALNIFLNQIENKKFKNILLDVTENIKNGETFSASLKKYSDVFTASEINIVSAGEHFGQLEFSLKTLSDNLSDKIELLKKIKNSALLPIITLIFSLFLIFGIFIFVLPQFQDLFSSFDKELPPSTKLVFDISNFLRSSNGIIFLIILFLIILFSKLLIKLSFFKKIKDKIFFNVYIFKTYFIFYDLVNFFQILSMFLACGIDLKKSLDYSIDVIDNSYLKERLLASKNLVINGEPFFIALKKYCSDFIPENIIAFVHVGEKTGKLSNLLERSAFYCKQILEQNIKNLVTIFQPILLIFIGLIIVFLMLSIYLPIFNMAGVF
ncbi:type II secretion system F family protein [Candidatus Dependentiae bacterium]|nr:type II secretion system F family protein [Candidatus Dependentiae bacterium]MBU4387740.1 type II secretion system F family protein [Candidatus Dependentiae bacterium]MCG2756332.1 type II secretion system F family protein [Candidatus Dependentiae bacterium]